jgi:Arc/MetJ family transcription regulator
VIDLDDELLADVAQALGTSTKKDTVNTALREVPDNRRRALALTRLRSAAEEGGFDLDLFEAGGCRAVRLGSGSGSGARRDLPGGRMEFFHGARSAEDRARGIEDMRLLFGWVPVDDRAYDRAWRVQGLLTRKGQRGTGAVDLVVAATAELQGLTLLHRDRDFDCIAAVTGQPLQWYGPDPGK